MYKPESIFKYLTVACISLLLLSCSNDQASTNREITVDTTEPEDTVRIVRTGETAEDKVEELRTWMNKQAERADTSIRREWPQIKEELRQRNAEIESNFDSLSTEAKAEYARLKNRYERWEQRQERRQQTPLDPQKVNQWQKQLLQEYADLDTISPENVREAYLTFMGEVRAKRRNWTQSDWDYVDHVYSQLNQRRRELEGRIPTSDKVKVRTLQAEYLTLEGAADAQSLMRDMRN